MTSSYTRISLAAAIAAVTVAMVPDHDPKAQARGEIRPSHSALADTTLADGAFTEDQVERGGEVFTRHCSECHSTSEMRGADFMFNWEGSSVGRLYRSITRTMPEDDPGGLSTSDYLGVISYILELNGFPTGEQELTASTELLNKLRIEN